MSTMTRTRRLLVTRRDPHAGGYAAVGELSRDEDERIYTFTYRDGVTRGLPGLPLGQTTVSSDLFPLFGHRVVSHHRADHDAALDLLALDPTAGPFEVLARSGGRSATDTLELTPIPEPGDFEVRFLVHGIRHLTEDERDHIDTLDVGQHLALTPEPDNPKDERAVLVTDDGHRLGYAPRPLLEYVRPAMDHRYELTVERINSRAAGFHMRLLVKLAGHLPR